jgi:hypothetical protein
MQYYEQMKPEDLPYSGDEGEIRTNTVGIMEE